MGASAIGSESWATPASIAEVWFSWIGWFMEELITFDEGWHGTGMDGFIF